MQNIIGMNPARQGPREGVCVREKERVRERQEKSEEHSRKSSDQNNANPDAVQNIIGMNPARGCVCVCVFVCVYQIGCRAPDPDGRNLYK